MKNRRKAIILSLLYTILACNQDRSKNIALPPENSRIVHLQFVDSLGNVTFYIPSRFDTSAVWIDRSDCGKPCETQKYRFQPKALRLIEESGFIFLGWPKDSVEQFTVSHQGWLRLHDGDPEITSFHHKHLIEKIHSDPSNPPIVFDTIEKIHDRYFSIIAMQRTDTIRSKIALASTMIKENEVDFEYKLLTRKDDSISRNFIPNAIKLLRTIEVQKGN